MVRLPAQYIQEFRDRHGKVRRYLRMPGRPRVALPGAPGSPAFMEVYNAAIAGAPKPDTGAPRRNRPGTVAAAVTSYFNSATFQAQKPDTRRTRRNILERFRADHGDKRIALLIRSHVERAVAAKAATPSSARNFLNTLRALMRHCLSEGLIKEDPTFGVKSVKIKTAGYRTWDEDDIAAFEAAHPIGSRARLALALLLYTGQRRGDVVRLGRQYIRGGALHLRQGKTGAALVIPVHPELAGILEATPSDHLTFLVTATGKPFSAAGFTNWFRDMCNAAGLPKGTSAHGLRKAACRRLAEAGCSASQIAAISGHATLREIQRYTAAADQARLAHDAMATVASAFPPRRTSIVKPGGKV